MAAVQISEVKEISAPLNVVYRCCVETVLKNETFIKETSYCVI
jgi:hypothetical protein